MKNKFFFLGLLSVLAISCRTPMQVTKIDTQKNINVNSEIAEDPLLSATITPYKLQMEKNMNTKISYTPVELTKKGDNSNLGNLLADYTFYGAEEWAKKNGITVDAAIINIGGIRTNIGAGNILLKHVYEVMPFENEVVIMKMKGKDLQGLFNYYQETQKNNPVSGLYIETENGKLTKGLIGGKAVDENRDYYIATSDYLALGGDNMKFFSKGELISTGLKLRDVFIDFFRRNPEVKTPSDLRLIFKGKGSYE